VSLQVLGPPPAPPPLGALAPPPLLAAPPAPMTAPPVVAAAGPDLLLLATVRVVGTADPLLGAVVSDLGWVLVPLRPFSRQNGKLGVLTPDGVTHPASLLAIDPPRNLAMLSVPSLAHAQPFVRQASLPEAGQPVRWMLQPPSGPAAVAQSRVVSRVALRDGRIDPLLFRLEPVLGPALEGAPVVNAQGELLGLVSAVQPGKATWAVSPAAVTQFLQALGARSTEFTLRVSSEPSGAVVRLDGQSVGRTGPSPLELHRLRAGFHQVELEIEGLAVDRLGVELLAEGTVELKRTLDSGGHVELASNAAADVDIDGARRGQVPLLVTLPSGPHRLHLEAKGRAPADQTLQVVSGARQALTVDLVAAPAGLTVNSLPPGAEVTVNGQKVGVTPLVGAAVPEGAVDVGLVAEGKHRYHFPVTLAPRETRDLGTFRLEDPYGWLEVAMPLGTKLAIDDAPPKVLGHYERLPAGPHTLRVYSPGYYGLELPVVVEDAKPVPVDLHALAPVDRNPPRRTAGLVAAGLSAGLGVTSLGLLTDQRSSGYAAPAAIGGLVTLGVALYLLVSGPPTDEAGWSTLRTPEPRP
jgi:hypothetical protein